MLKAGRCLAFCCLQGGEAALEAKEHQKGDKPSAGLDGVGFHIWKSERLLQPGRKVMSAVYVMLRCL